MPNALTIGQLATATGVPARTIRYYEHAGVLPPPARTPSGYRRYDQRAVQRMIFVRRARALRLPLHRVRALVAALDGPPARDVRPRVRALVRAQLTSVHERIAELDLLRRDLEHVLRRLPSASRDAQGCRCLTPSTRPG